MKPDLLLDQINNSRDVNIYIDGKKVNKVESKDNEIIIKAVRHSTVNELEFNKYYLITFHNKSVSDPNNPPSNFIYAKIIAEESNYKYLIGYIAPRLVKSCSACFKFGNFKPFCKDCENKLQFNGELYWEGWVDNNLFKSIEEIGEDDEFELSNKV